MISHRVKLAVLAAGLMAVSLPINALNAADADIKISVPKPEANEQIAPMPDVVIIDPSKANQKPREEKIKKSKTYEVEADDWRKDKNDKIWKWHKSHVLLMNCTKDALTVRTFNQNDTAKIIPRWKTTLKPGQHTSRKIDCNSPKVKDRCRLQVGTAKHGFIGWSDVSVNAGPYVLFGTAEHVALYSADPNAISKGCQSFKLYMQPGKVKSLPN